MLNTVLFVLTVIWYGRFVADADFNDLITPWLNTLVSNCLHIDHICYFYTGTFFNQIVNSNC